MAKNKLGALWLREAKDGKKYFSGVIETLNGDVPIVIFKNDHKEKDNHPDYVVYRSEPKEDKDKGNTQEDNSFPTDEY